MKARDLAALAALGIAGKMAYDKFGRKKDDEPKTKGELGKSQSANDGDEGERQTRMDNYSNEGRGKAAKFADEDYSNEGRSAKFANEDYSNEGRGKTAPVAVAKPVRKQEVESRSLDSKGGPARFRSEAGSSGAQTDVEDYGNEGRRTGQASQDKIAAMNVKNGAASPSARQTDALRATARKAAADDTAKRRTSGTLPQVQAAKPQSMARYPGGLAKRGANVSVPEDKPITRILGTDQDYLDAMMATAPVGPLAKLAAKAAYTKDKPLNYSTQPALGNSNTPLLGAPAKQLTGPSKADLMARDRASRTTSRDEAMTRENADRYGLNPNAPGYDAAASSLRDRMGGRDFTLRKKGGVVRMASGGMTSSKMSKPSGASRGDGIAQRGRTRGTLR
jgi:hypothetical protein